MLIIQSFSGFSELKQPESQKILTEGLHSAVSAKLSTDPQEIMNKQKKNYNYTDRSVGFSLVLTLGKIY